MEEKIRPNNILIGIAGEHFVAAELSRRGYIASMTLKNTKGIDILASNGDASRLVGIQVKATRYNTTKWMLNEKAENYYAENLFYIFVNLKEINQRPDFFIVPSKIVASYIKRDHKNWLKTSSKLGRKHKNSSIRKFGDLNKFYLERWDILNL